MSRSLCNLAVAVLTAVPAAAQINQIQTGPTQLTAKQVPGAIQLDWLTPNPSSPGITYNVLRSDGTTQPTVVVSARPVPQTTYLDPLTTLGQVQPKTYTYQVQALWPNGMKRLSNLATVTIPAAQQVPIPGGPRCLSAFDLPVQFSVETEVSRIVMLHVVVPVSSPYPNPMTVTVRNSSNPSKFPNVSFKATSWQGFDEAYYPNVPGNSLGVVGDQLSLTLDIDVAVADAQCTTHLWTKHWAHSGPLP